MAKKQCVGVVVSNKPKKTIIVAIQKKYRHPKYAKMVIKTKKFMAHNEKHNCSIGSIVLIQESAPFSKYKTWETLNILK